MSSAQSPDYVEALTGWRAWVVRPDLVLASFNGTSWPVCERLAARCAKPHDPPEQTCTCGIYAAASSRDLGSMPYPRYDLDRGHVVVAGEVALWGGVVPGGQGWRAQYAYPKRLLVPYECWRVAGALGEKYGVPVRLANTYRLKEGIA